MKRVLYQGESLLEDEEPMRNTHYHQLSNNIRNFSNLQKIEQNREDQRHEQQERKQPTLVFEKENDVEEEKMKDYLELVDFVMSQGTLTAIGNSNHCNGIMLKGCIAPSNHHEKALKLLNGYGYNFNLAKFHILYPSVMAIPE